MKNILILAFLCFLFTSCEHECPVKDFETPVDVEIYAYGQFSVTDIDGTNHVNNFIGTKFKVVFLKKYCSGKYSKSFDYQYSSLTDGFLDKTGIGTFSFTMQNVGDEIEFYVYTIDPEGKEYKIGESIASNGNWESGKIRLNLFINLARDSEGNLYYKTGTVIFDYQY